MSSSSTVRVLLAILLLAAVALVGCLSSNNSRSVPRVWQSQPPVPVDAALTKALAFLRDRQQDISSGYDLRAGRRDGYWWFDFLLLPRSPDFEITVRVFDSGDIQASGMAPPKISVKGP